MRKSIVLKENGMVRCDFRLLVGLTAAMMLSACGEGSSDDENRVAKEGQACSDEVLCDQGLECNAKHICVPKSSDTKPETTEVGAGEVCDDTHVCVSGYKCDSATKICVAESSNNNPSTSKEGENCDSTHICESGLNCGASGKCEKAQADPVYVGLDETCDGVTRKCSGALLCLSDKCQNLPTPSLVGEGQACDFTTKICGENLYCGSDGKCQKQVFYETVSEGEKCDDTHRCADNLYCDADTKKCKKNVQITTSPENGPCGDLTHACEEGLVCSGTICIKPVTITVVGEGAKCDDTHICEKGTHYCNSASVCAVVPDTIETVGKNEVCDRAHVCDVELSCIESKCKEIQTGDVGASCDEKTKFCQTGLYCNTTGRCVKPISQVIVDESDACDGATRICDTTKGLACISHVCVVPPEEILIDCKNGQQVDKSCVCTTGYAVDEAGICTVCAENYEMKSGKCSLIIVEPDTCEAEFYYTNQWTHTQSGGTANFDVYLVGSFNEWKEADATYKMTYLGDGTHGIRIKVTKGDKISYKFYVNGWAEDSWKSDPANASYDTDGNNVADISACGLAFGNANSKSVDHPYVEGEDPGTVEPPEPDDPVVDPDCITTFSFFNKYTAKEACGEDNWDVYLIGEMNEWKVADPAFKLKADGKGGHTISLALPKNTSFKYKFYINGWGENSYHADLGKCADGDCNNIVNVSSCGQTISLEETDHEACSDNPTPPTPSNDNLSLASSSVSGKTVTIKVNAKDGVKIASVEGGSGSAKLDGTTITDTVTENNKYNYIIKSDKGDELYVPVWVEDNKFDWHDAVLYFAFTDRFLNGDTKNDGKSGTCASCAASDWYGGDFKGLKAKVDDGYFTKLGVNTLWISSVSMNTQDVSWGTGSDTGHSYSAYHSYWPVATFMYEDTLNDFKGAKSKGKDITAIEPHFGTMDDLKALVDACHKQGIRVLVDFAANHVHKDSPIIAKHNDWINDYGHERLCDDNGNWDNYSEKCWFSADLPDINYDNGAARDAMVKHAVWLIKQTNIDGFRVDAVKHMNIQFIKDLRAAVDKLFANTGIMFYMVGETFTGNVDLLNKYIGDGLLHAQFDFPLYYKVQNVIKGYGFYDIAKNYNARFNSDLMGTFMGNHDVARALSVAAGQNEGKWGNNPDVTDWVPYFNVKTAWTILMTRPGVPLIYYGDEAGMPGSNDPDNRRMMIFGDQLNDQQKSMLDYVSRLGQIRKAHPALRTGERRDLTVNNENWCYLMEKGSDKVLVAISTIKGSGCDLGGSYKLQSLLSDDAKEFTTSHIDMSTDHLNVYLVK